MRRLVKILFGLVALVLFIGILGLFSQVVQIPWLSSAVGHLIVDHLWLFSFFEWILLILGGLLTLILLLVLSVSARRKRLVIKDGLNRTEVLRSTLIQIVQTAYDSMIPPDKTKVTVKIKGEGKVIVKLKIEVRSKEDFAPTADKIKWRVENVLSKALEPIESSVIVSLKEKAPTDSASFGKRQSRVV